MGIERKENQDLYIWLNSTVLVFIHTNLYAVWYEIVGPYVPESGY